MDLHSGRLIIGRIFAAEIARLILGGGLIFFGGGAYFGGLFWGLILGGLILGGLILGRAYFRRGLLSEDYGM